MSKEVGEIQRTYSRSFTDSVFARFDALDEHAQRLDMRLKLIVTKLEGLSLYEERAFSALVVLDDEVSEVALLVKAIERQLNFISGI